MVSLDDVEDLLSALSQVSDTHGVRLLVELTVMMPERLEECGAANLSAFEIYNAYGLSFRFHGFDKRKKLLLLTIEEEWGQAKGVAYQGPYLQAVLKVKAAVVLTSLPELMETIRFFRKATH